MLFNRETGILLHPTSLPGPWGIGTLGSEAEVFIGWMADSGATVWQILPISPPVCNNSPYQALSSFALNPLLLSPEKLAEDGLLLPSELNSSRSQCGPSVDWRITSRRSQLIEMAASRALTCPHPGFEDFASREWVRRWSRFAAKKELNSMRPWHLWKNLAPPPEQRVMVHSMVQFLLERQWQSVRSLAISMGIRILGDVPVYTALDSSDVYCNRSIFKLDPLGSPTFVAGVPPDYFSKTGQLWGNPVYNWTDSAATGHRWWTNRMRRSLELFDTVRIDHFRGFESYWEIPAGSSTAENGRWSKGPGLPFFDSLRKSLGELPFVAEDLGLITDKVVELREKCGFPGMTVLQFALQDKSFDINSVSPSTIVYTGTHDNDTTAGWVTSTGASLGYSSVKEIVSMALSSPAELAVIPVQDVLELDSTARMNTPATIHGNWSFRLCSYPPQADLTRTH